MITHRLSSKCPCNEHFHLSYLLTSNISNFCTLWSYDTRIFNMADVFFTFMVKQELTKFQVWHTFVIIVFANNFRDSLPQSMSAVERHWWESDTGTGRAQVVDGNNLHMTGNWWHNYAVMSKVNVSISHKPLRHVA